MAKIYAALLGVYGFLSISILAWCIWYTRVTNVCDREVFIKEFERLLE